MFHEETIGGDLRDGSPLGCADPPIFVPSASGRKWSPFFDNTDSATQLHHAHLSDGSGHDSLQTSTKDSLVQSTRWNNKPFTAHVDQRTRWYFRLAPPNFFWGGKNSRTKVPNVVTRSRVLYRDACASDWHAKHEGGRPLRPFRGGVRSGAR